MVDHRPSRPPRFTFHESDSLADERTHRKQRLAAAFRLFGRFGFGEGIAGHITARDPEHADRFWVNPFGMNFRQIRASDLILVDHSGEVVEGDWPVNRAAFAIHSRVHAARPDVVAAAHSHAVFGRSFSTLGRPLAPLTQDACAFHDDQAVFDDYTGVVEDPAEGDRIAAALGRRKLAILRNHGLLTVGTTVDPTDNTTTDPITGRAPGPGRGHPDRDRSRHRGADPLAGGLRRRGGVQLPPPLLLDRRRGARSPRLRQPY